MFKHICRVILSTILLTIGSIGLSSDVFSQTSDQTDRSDRPANEAVLFDEFGKECSEMVSARYDLFLVEMQKAPGSKGYVIFHGANEQEGHNLSFFRHISQIYPSFRGVPDDWLIFIRAENYPEMNVRFWLVPDGAEPPEIENKYQPKKINSQTLFHRAPAEFFKELFNFPDREDDDFISPFPVLEGCEFAPNLDEFAKALLADENLKGRLLAPRSPENEQKILDFAFDQLVKIHKVSPHRLEKVFGNEEVEYPELELWLMPAEMERQGAKLIDQIDERTCEDYRERLDIWFVEVNKDPDAVGYAVIKGGRDEFNQRIIFREWIGGHLKLRFQDEVVRRKFRIIDGNDSGELEVRLWKAKRDDDPPVEPDKNWSLKLPEERIYELEYNDPYGICAPFDENRIFPEILKANPDRNVRIYIHAPSRKDFEHRKKELSRTLSGIPQKDIGFFFVKDKYSYVKYRLIPKSNDV